MKRFTLIAVLAALLLSVVSTTNRSLASQGEPLPTTVVVPPDPTGVPDPQPPPEIASQEEIPAQGDGSAPNRLGAEPNYVSSYALHTRRVSYLPYRGFGIATIRDTRITPNSKVFASISELDRNGRRFIGAAPMKIESVAPAQGYVRISLRIDWNTRLPFQIDYLIVNA